MGKRTTCEEDVRFSVLMSLDIDGMLDSGEQGQLQQHLASCPACRAQWDAMRVASALLAAEPMVGPPLGFAIRVGRKLEEHHSRRRLVFNRMAIVTGGLSLVGAAATTVAVVVLAVLTWNWISAQPALQLGGDAVSQVASGVGLIGKGASLFLKDLLMRYGVPVVLLLGTGLTVLAGVWSYLFVKRPGNYRGNGYV
jgi:predicted anti-sigma-YlaC factor YlaD